MYGRIFLCPSLGDCRSCVSALQLVSLAKWPVFDIDHHLHYWKCLNRQKVKTNRRLNNQSLFQKHFEFWEIWLFYSYDPDTIHLHLVVSVCRSTSHRDRPIQLESILTDFDNFILTDADFGILNNIILIPIFDSKDNIPILIIIVMESSTIDFSDSFPILQFCLFLIIILA